MNVQQFKQLLAMCFMVAAITHLAAAECKVGVGRSSEDSPAKLAACALLAMEWLPDHQADATAPSIIESPPS